MGIFDKIFSMIPRPFRYIQRKLDIQKQWVDFKSNIKPHKYKLSVGLLLITYPLYSTYLKQSVQYSKTNQVIISNKVHSLVNLHFNGLKICIFALIFSIKHLLQHIFIDPRVKEQAMDFVFGIIKDEKFYNNLLQLLLSALKSETFMKELKQAIKEIMIQQLKDQEVRQSINDLLISLSQNNKVKTAFIQLIQQVFSSKESTQTIINLLKKGITNQEVKEALGQSVNYAVREVLSDQQTLNQLKIFIFFLLRRFETDDQIKGMMDILFAKGLGLVKKKKDPQLDKFLKPKKTEML